MSGAVLFAYERPAIATALGVVLRQHGYSLDHAASAEAARDRLERTQYTALVLDVALPGLPGDLLIADARGLGVEVVVLISAAYRRSRYKREPARLYGADAHLEVHDLGHKLGSTLDELLGRPPLRSEQSCDPPDEVLPRRVVGDVILFHAERLLHARGRQEANMLLEEDLQCAKAVLASLVPNLKGRDPFDDAVESLMAALGRNAEVWS